MSLTVARLKHQIKVFGGHILGHYLSKQYARDAGPASRLISTFSNKAKEIGVQPRILVTTTSSKGLNPHYSLDGDTERSYRSLFSSAEVPVSRAGTFCAPNVEVSFPTGMHRVSGYVLKEFIPVSYLLTNPKYYYGLESMRFRTKKQLDRGVLLSMPFHHNFYHWMIDILPRLALYDRDPDMKSAPIILPRSSPRFVSESLKLAGYQEKVIFLDDGVYRFKTLHMLSLLSPMMAVSTEAVNWLNSKFPQSSQRTPTRIYVSRRDAKIRFVSNESEFADQLSALGFHTVVMSDLSLADQIALFRNADCIIGPHGAGFANLVFAKPGTTFIEFFSRGHDAPCFNRIASIRAFRYGFLVGEPTAIGGFSINPNALRDVLSQALH